MATEHASPLEVDFLPDGRVRIGETVLGAEDSETFIAQFADGDPTAFIGRAAAPALPTGVRGRHPIRSRG